MFTAVLQNAAVIAAIVAAITWAVNRGEAFLVKRRVDRHRRRIALIRFQTEIRLRREGLEGVDAPGYVDATISMIERHAEEGRAFRLYGAQVTDSLSNDEIDDYLDEFDVETIYLVKKVVLLDRLMIAEYEGMRSADFEKLEPRRQIAAFRKWIDVARDLRANIETLASKLQSLPHSTLLPFRSRYNANERKDDRAHSDT